MPIPPFKVLLALLCALLASVAHGSVTYTWHGDCVDRYLSGILSPDIGGCEAVNGVVSGAIGVPDDYVWGTSYDFQFAPAGPARPSFILDDPFLPIATEMFGSGSIDFTLIGGVPMGHWFWIASNLLSIGGTGDMYFNIDYDATSIFHVAATRVVFDNILPPCLAGPPAVCPTPGTLPLILLGLLVLLRSKKRVAAPAHRANARSMVPAVGNTA